MSKASKVGYLVGFVLLRTLWIGTMVAVPLFGFWLASSLAAFNNASQWLALLVGLLLFPIVPVGWELFYAWRRKRSNPDAKSILTRLDRLVLRTLLVNGLFLGLMIWRAPQTSFRAVAVRGDWFVDGYEGAFADGVRGFLLGFADRFEKRWHEVDDRYGHSDVAPDTVPDEPTATTTTDTTTPETKAPYEWPVAPEPDVQVTDMPADAQVSIDAVAQYLKARFPDPKRLAKAVHDYIVLRTTYDDVALAKIMAHDYANTPSQEAETVFATKTGVCEGYARLYVALGKAAGLDVAYITGVIRDAHRRVSETNANGSQADDATVKAALDGYSHAWNAVKLDGQWKLVDATWDDAKGAPTPVQSTYLFTPPQYFRYDHLPDDAAWQLVGKAMSPGEFVRQPLMTPYAGQLGLTLLSPDRSQVTVGDGSVEIVVDNPGRVELVADAVVDGSGDADGKRCTVKDLSAKRQAITCDLGRGEYEIRMFGIPRAALDAVKSGGGHRFSYSYVGSILANSR